jgi:hypothetical protein
MNGAEEIRLAAILLWMRNSPPPLAGEGSEASEGASAGWPGSRHLSPFRSCCRDLRVERFTELPREQPRTRWRMWHFSPSMAGCLRQQPN